MKKAINICIAVAMSVMALSLTNCKGEETKTAVAPQKETIEIDTALRSKLQKFATKPRCKGASDCTSMTSQQGKRSSATRNISHSRRHHA